MGTISPDLSRALTQRIEGASAEGPHGLAPLVVLAGVGARASDVLGAARTAGRNVRTWVVVPQPWSSTLIAELDEGFDAPGAPPVDAIVLLPGGEPVAQALALEGWLRLRHDAPSAALSDLRDAGGACRFAAVVGLALPARPEESNGPERSGEHAVLRVRQAVDANVRAAAEQARVHAEMVAAADELQPSDISVPAASPVPTAPSTAVNGADEAVPDRAFDAALSGIASDDVDGFTAAADDCEQASLRAQTELEGALARLSEAGLAALRADSTWRAERDRSGVAARLSRRRRLAAATPPRMAALHAWADAYQGAAVAQSRRNLTSGYGVLLRQAADKAQALRADRRAQAAEKASNQWLTGAVEATAALPDPAGVAVERMARAWGRATPQVRRHLLLPPTDEAVAGGAEAAVAGNPGDVEVHLAPEVSGPLGLAMLMGVPLRALLIGGEPVVPVGGE